MAATSTISAHGTAESSLLPTSSTVTAAAEIRTDQPFKVPIPATRSPTFATNSAPESIFTPSIFASWLTMMSRASPPTKPTRMGFERKFARNPSLKTASRANIAPQMIACARARVAYVAVPAAARPPMDEATRAAAAASGEATSCRDETTRA